MVPLPGFGHICGQSLNMLKKIDFSRHKFECLQIQTDSPQLLIRRSGEREGRKRARSSGSGGRILNSREGAWSVSRRRLPNRFTGGSGYEPDADLGTSRRRPPHSGKFYSSDGVRHIGGSINLRVWTHSIPLLYPLSRYAVPMPIVRIIFLCRL